MADNERTQTVHLPIGPVRTSVEVAEEPMPFNWRVTRTGNADLKVEIGDEFTEVPGVGSPVEQVALGMVMQGLNLLGADKDTRDMIAFLAMAMVKQ